MSLYPIALPHRVLSALAQIGKSLRRSSPLAERTIETKMAAFARSLNTALTSAILYRDESGHLLLPAFLLHMPFRMR